MRVVAIMTRPPLQRVSVEAVPGDWKCKAGLQLQCSELRQDVVLLQSGSSSSKSFASLLSLHFFFAGGSAISGSSPSPSLGAVATPRAKRRSSALVRDLFSSDKKPQLPEAGIQGSRNCCCRCRLTWEFSP